MHISRNLKPQFLLDPSITYLNFGSFGACPAPVFREYQKWQLELEREPVQFIAVNSTTYLKRAREALAAYVGCAAPDLVYVTNPSYAVNIIAKSLNLKEGDEVLTTDLEYGACEKALRYYCVKSGARLVKQAVSLPVVSKAQIVASFLSGITDRTRLIFISQITSATALILPVEEICAAARARGIMTFVDGAHAPGQLPLDLDKLEADIYTGACHKWMLAPKGASFLYVKPEYQHLFDPLVVSWGYDAEISSGSKFLDYHEMQGTRDFSAFLAVPAAIRFMKDNSWPDVAARCRRIVLDNGARFAALLQTEPLSPLSEEFVAQMLSLPVRTSEPEALQRHLFTKYSIEIPVMRHGGRCFIRYSINGFNSQQDLDRLYVALKEVIASGGYIQKSEPTATEGV